ncbi:TBC1 domain family member 3H [Striga asiatica]|uniref:TBC1 domain family member 3H n=1 Tax=Striga asiatica TaxID=4170 RepID=A0A5A7QLD6_STRAF|nr:TBC1 domain family member 3H [Striga asiatica]
MVVTEPHLCALLVSWLHCQFALFACAMALRVALSACAGFLRCQRCVWVARGGACSPAMARGANGSGFGNAGGWIFLQWSLSPSFVVVRGAAGTYIRRDAKTRPRDLMLYDRSPDPIRHGGGLIRFPKAS